MHCKGSKITGRYFGAERAIADIQDNQICPIPDVHQAINRTNRVPPGLENSEERAAIIEFDAGLLGRDGEHLAAQKQGYDNVVDLRPALEGKKCSR